MPRAIDVANEALATIRTHLKVCEVKHEQIAKNQEQAQKDRELMHRENQESLRRIYALLWRLVIGTGSAVIAFLAYALWQLSTK